MTNTNTDLAWAAGFFEGEGSVDIKKRPDNNYLIRVSVSNCVSAYLHRLISMFGGKAYTRRDIDTRAKTQKRHKWAWEIGADKAYRFLEAILPFMTSRGKIEEVKLAIEFQKHLIGVPITLEVMRKREELWGKIREIRHADDAPIQELIDANTK